TWRVPLEPRRLGGHREAHELTWQPLRLRHRLVHAQTTQPVDVSWLKHGGFAQLVDEVSALALEPRPAIDRPLPRPAAHLAGDSEHSCPGRTPPASRAGLPAPDPTSLAFEDPIHVGAAQSMRLARRDELLVDCEVPDLPRMLGAECEQLPHHVLIRSGYG